ncbi:DUF192 domain-containing protein [Serpentinicella alkaliphila]|uniref:DUF192 domain-containing protein n=1 Tax=Serpentinicella alkaliphila TaxID=1734049 RepID=A0A4R2TGY1_9FIRM|nr:DUF192 domain-containing protein [Serpentinicella alkaliphila]QUH27003.1 DUF192 domain-containing protein [Serpentinicella alkaliphila]TCQ01497.1 hypothetical protein EDD79_102716 [Serpentinicella alkaliphila]
MEKTKYKILNSRNGEILASKVVLADTFWLRLKGLIGRDNIEDEEALILYPCSEIHCYGMKFNIDIIFLDKDKKVISCIDNIIPGSRARVKDAKYAIEFKAGLVKKKQVKKEDILVFEECLF